MRDVGKDSMVEGLRLTMRGEEIRRRLDQRIGIHEKRAARWKREQKRTKADETEDAPLMPDHICANEEKEEGWRVEVLAFIRDHVDEHATYRLSEADLAFGELLPEKPGWMQQAEYEQQTAVGFQLERLASEVRRLDFAEGMYAGRMAMDGSPGSGQLAAPGESDRKARAPRRRRSKSR